MDDDVRELARKCAEIIGIAPDLFVLDGPRAQAFELLCWLASKGTVEFALDENGWFIFDSHAGIIAREFIRRTPAELRLALMRATVKVHEGRGK